MKYWFLWDGMNSDNMGLWISKMPKITRPKERYDSVTIPGRAGSLTLLEGEDVYESYVKEIVVQTLRQNPRIGEIMNWLRGESDLILSNEIQYAYHGRIAGEVSFDRISNDLMQATIPVFVEPFKRSADRNKDKITLTGPGFVRNPGNITSKPKVTVTGSGTVVINGSQMAVYDGWVIDCDAHIVNSGGQTMYGEAFWTLQPGENTVDLQGGVTSILIEPEWRWI